MMHKKYRLLYLMIYLMISLMLTVVSCETREEPEEIVSTELEYTAKKISRNELENFNPEIVKMAEHYNIANNLESQRVTSRFEVNEFHVLTNEIGYLQKGDYDSYTFPVIRTGTEYEGFENLLISKQPDNTYKAMLVYYDVTEVEKNQLLNDEAIDLSDQIGFIDVDFDFTTLISETGSRRFTIEEAADDCPNGSCCRIETSISAGTGWPLYEAIETSCDDLDNDPSTNSGGGGSDGTGGTSGGGGTNTGGDTHPDDDGDIGHGGGNGGHNNNNNPCTSCQGDGTIPIIPLLDFKITVDPTLVGTCARQMIYDFILTDFTETGIFGPNSNVEATGLINEVFDALGGNGPVDVLYEGGAIGARNGTTAPPTYNPTTQQYSTTVTISNNLLNNGSKIAVAKTILHESIHAYLKYVQATDPIGFNDPQGDFSDMITAFAAYSNFGYAQHIFIAGLVKAMAFQLKKYAIDTLGYPSDDASYPRNDALFYFEAIAWSGVSHVRDPANPGTPNMPNIIINPAFQTAYPNAADQQLILNIAAAENTGITTNGQSQMPGFDCN